MTSLIRLIALALVGATALAVGVSRLQPQATGWRMRRPAGVMCVKSFYFMPSTRAPLMLDCESGQLSPWTLPEGDALDAASCSPWRDDQGRIQVVGRWTRQRMEGAGGICEEFGLARCTFPDGEVLDRIPLDTVPVGPPCWYPGTRARVLYPSGDGQLYRFAFEPEQGSDEESSLERAPVPIPWRCPMPGKGKPYLADVCWPDDPRMSRCLIATLRLRLDGDNEPIYSAERLWWLKLDEAGRAIVAAGPVFAPDGSTPADPFEERCPSVTHLPGGAMELAYLRRGERTIDWDLRVVRLGIDASRGIPNASRSDSAALAGKCLPMAPAFSSDGRIVSAVQWSDRTHGRVVRVPASSSS